MTLPHTDFINPIGVSLVGHELGHRLEFKHRSERDQNYLMLNPVLWAPDMVIPGTQVEPLGVFKRIRHLIEWVENGTGYTIQ